MNMSIFERLGFGGHEKPKPKSKEEKIIFEEVADDEPEDFTYQEDPVEVLAERVLALEDDIAKARDGLKQGKGDEASVMVKEVMLAKTRFEQARQNEQSGQCPRGEADRLLALWQAAQDHLDNVRDEQVDRARVAVFARYKENDIDADTAAQLRRHP